MISGRLNVRLWSWCPKSALLMWDRASPRPNYISRTQSAKGCPEEQSIGMLNLRVRAEASIQGVTSLCRSIGGRAYRTRSAIVRRRKCPNPKIPLANFPGGAYGEFTRYAIPRNFRLEGQSSTSTVTFGSTVHVETAKAAQQPTPLAASHGSRDACRVFSLGCPSFAIAVRCSVCGCTQTSS